MRKTLMEMDSEILDLIEEVEEAGCYSSCSSYTKA